MSKRRPAAAVAALLAVAALAATGLAGQGTARARAAGGAAHLADAGRGHHQRPPFRQRSLTVNPMVGDRTRPNIVVFMSDDARYDDLRFMPNVEKLIEGQGVQFVNGFAPEPLCCPARASFDTGEYSQNHHVWSNAYPWGFHALRDGNTLPVWLHEAGYNTVFLGKYLNGYGVEPTRSGRPSLHYVPPGWTDWRGAVEARLGSSPVTGGTYRYFDTTLSINGRLVGHRGQYQTNVLARQSEQIFRQYARSPQPFFFWDSFVAPHHGLPHEADDPTPWVRPDGSVERFHTAGRPRSVWGRFNAAVKHAPGWLGERDVSDKPFYVRDLPPLNSVQERAALQITRERAEALSVLDHQIGNMIHVLKVTGQLDNTYIFFVSDNGYMLGEHRMVQGKVLPYESSLRVPVLVRGPGIPAGQVRTDPFTMIDFAPTFLQIAGAPRPPTIDGVSMLDVAEHGDRGWTRGILTDTGPRSVTNSAAESDNFLTTSDRPSPLRFTEGVRTRDYLYTEVATGMRELYDLRTDPGEQTNLIHRKSEQDVVRALARELARLRTCHGRECSQPLPPLLRSR